MPLTRPTALFFVTAVIAALALGAGCPTSTTGAGTGTTVTGDATNGQADFASICSRCHASTAVPKAGASLITNHMGSVNLAMISVTLTDQQVADLKAFLATQ